MTREAQQQRLARQIRRREKQQRKRERDRRRRDRQRVRERSERVQWHLGRASPSLGRAKGAGGERCDVGYHGCRCPPVSKTDRRAHHGIDCAASVAIARLPAFEPRELARLLPVVTAGGLAHQFTASLCPASSRHMTAAHVEGATPDVDAGACRTGPHL